MFGDSGYGAQLRLDNPVLDSSQIDGVHGFAGRIAGVRAGFDRVHEDLAQPPCRRNILSETVADASLTPSKAKKLITSPPFCKQLMTTNSFSLYKRKSPTVDFGDGL